MVAAAAAHTLKVAPKASPQGRVKKTMESMQATRNEQDREADWQVFRETQYNEYLTHLKTARSNLANLKEKISRRGPSKSDETDQEVFNKKIVEFTNELNQLYTSIKNRDQKLNVHDRGKVLDKIKELHRINFEVVQSAGGKHKKSIRKTKRSRKFIRKTKSKTIRKKRR